VNWYDASDNSTLFTSDSGSTHPTVTGDPIGRWEDKSGQGNHLTQGVAAQRPTLISPGKNTRDVVDFDGTQYVFDGALASNMSMTSTVFIVMRVDSASGTQAFYGFTSAPVTTNSYMTMTGGSSSITYRGRTDSLQVGTVADGATPTTWNYWMNQYGDGPYMVLRQNSGTTWNTNIAFGTTTLRRLYLGYATAPFGDFLNGKIAEFICYNRALTASEQQSIRNYLAAKWAI